MSDVEVNEPPSKMKKRDDSKCIGCKKFCRIFAQNKIKVFLSRPDAEKFFSDYNTFVQIGDKICEECYRKLRLAKSLKSKIASNKSLDTIQNNDNPEVLPSQVSNDEIQIAGTSDIGNPAGHCEDPIYNTPPNNEILSQSSLTDSEVDQNSAGSSSNQTICTSSSAYTLTPKEEIETVPMPFPRVISSHAYCFICRSKVDLQNVTFEARMQVFIKRRIFILRRNRCCKMHLIKGRFYDDELKSITSFSHEYDIEVTELKMVLDNLSDKVESSILKKVSTYSISEERVKALTGHSWNDILDIRNLLTTMRDSENRNVLQALVLFLFKIRSGNSDKLIASIMEVTERVVNDSVNAVLNCFKDVVLPKHFSVNAHSREFCLNQSSSVARLLYNTGNSLAIICDGTYLRHQKSSNNIYQRKSYSGQKKTPLVKPFTICTTNGFIVDLPGPFNANKNDAEILKYVMQDPSEISSILVPGDIFILDRGFRDVKQFLEQKDLIVLMPALKGKRKQLSTKESNQSRFVTKIRWVVESVHGILGQKYKLLHHQFNNNLLHSAGLYCKIACFLHNLTGKRLNSDINEEDQIIQRMLATQDNPNTLAEKVGNANYNRKSAPFQEISSSEQLESSELTLDDLKILFTGTYQLSQAISYLGEMLTDENKLYLSYLKEEPGIVRFEVKSRHINSKTYKCYVQYDAADVGLTAIKGYCCSCANGLRTIGCCSHTAALIYYLSYGRYLSKTIRPAEALTNLFDVDNVLPVIDEDSDED